MKKSDMSAQRKKLIKSIDDMLTDLTNHQLMELLKTIGQMVEVENTHRKSGRQPCIIGVEYNAGTMKFQNYIMDISANGLFIETKESLSVGGELKMTFSLPGEEKPFNVIGRVVRQTESGVGVKIEQMTQYHEMVLKSLFK